MKHLFILVSLLAMDEVFTERKLPSYITPCKRFDPEISKCWEKTLLDLRPYLTKGIPEFDVSPLTEFRVDELHLNQDNTQNVNFVADLHNLTIYGANIFDVIYTKADFKGLVLEEGLTFPHLKMIGRYKAKGKILVFEFEGEGDLQIELDDVKINGTWYFKTIQKKGKEHMQIDKSQADVTIEKIKVNFDNLFRNNPEITKNINNAINENFDLLYNDFKPLLQKTLLSILNRYFNRVYSLFSFDVLLPPK